MNEILLSIMIETYNQEKYISQTLDSILNQEFTFNYEILIGDDCSSDSTPHILDKYSLHYKNVTVFHNQHNLGAMGNYYNLLKHCKGKYIMDCAGDDYWLEGKVNKQISFMEKNNDYGICVGNVYNYYESKKIMQENKFSGTFLFNDLIKGNKIAALTVCIRKNLLDLYLKEINPEAQNWQMEDYPMWLWFAYNSKIYHFDDFFGVYRVLPESVSHSESNLEKRISFIKDTLSIRNFYITRYNINNINFDSNLIIFNECYKYFKETKKNKNNCYKIAKQYYPKIKNKNLKLFIKQLLMNCFR